MVKLNKIYTRTGDDGTTGLADGTRRGKNDMRIQAYGAIDEANSAIGMARLFSRTPEMNLLDDMLARLQNDFFDLGADLSTPYNEKANKPDKALRIHESQSGRLETEIDRLNQDLSPLTSFVLPGGSPLAAHLHLARTITRRAECHIVAAMADKSETFNPHALHFTNRASDLLFVAARWANLHIGGDVLWRPAASQNKPDSG